MQENQTNSNNNLNSYTNSERTSTSNETKNSNPVDVKSTSSTDSFVYIPDNKTQNQIISELEKYALLGDIDAQYNLADRYYIGSCVERDIFKALYWYEKSAEQGHIEAIASLCEFYLESEFKDYFNDDVDVEKHLLKVISFCESAVEREFPWATDYLKQLHCILADIYIDGLFDTHTDINNALELFLKIVEEGNGNSVLYKEIANIYYKQQNYPEALKWYIELAKEGDDEAKDMADYIYHSKGRPHNPEDEIKWIKNAVELGYSEAQAELGANYCSGWDVSQDYVKGIKLLTAAIKNGSEIAITELMQRIYMLTKEAEQGNASAQYQLGQAFLCKDCLDISKTDAIRWFTKAAEQGYGPAQYQLGKMYFYGDGINADPIKSKEWFSKAAEWYINNTDTNNPENLYIKGIIFLNGYGVSLNESQALEFFTEAAKQGYGPAQYELGVMLLMGDIITPDPSKSNMWFTKAAEWYTKTAEEGDPEAQCVLGKMYLYGYGVIKDQIASSEWLLKAAQQDIKEAQYLMGLLNLRGNDELQDKFMAKYWLSKATIHGGYYGEMARMTIRDMDE